MLTLTLGACSGGGTGDAGSTDAGTGTSAFVAEADSLDATNVPSGYPAIPTADFGAAFEELKDANMAGAIETYQDVANIFVVDGAHFVNQDFEDGDTVFKYFGWFSDADEAVFVTFMVDGNELQYYGYVSDGIM